jgi:hypothetical protein
MSQATTNALTLTRDQVIANLNSTVVSVITADGMQGFEKAFLIAEATAKLKAALTPEYMKPIMELQNTKLGFMTDKKEGGYPESVVKNCLIEAVLTGVQPFGNQFNIIAGNCYITKEGFGHLLKNTEGLTYEIIPQLPRIDAAKGSAAIVMKIEWSYKDQKKTREIEFPIKVNQFMGADAVIGKATRKARAWLFNTIHNTEVADGDVMDVDHKVVRNEPELISKDTKEKERVRLMINDATTLDDLKKIEPHVGEDQLDLFVQKQDELKSKRNGAA